MEESLFQQALDLLNNNPGVVSASIFVSTLIIGWMSGVFRVVRQKPQLKIETIEGPTFACVFGTGGEFRGYKTHGVGVALYLKVLNVGVSATNITGIKVGYHWHASQNPWTWIRYRLGWFYLNDQIVALADFSAFIGENEKVYPFLQQKGFASGQSTETYLESGNFINGVVYFEQRESWGSCYPASRNRRTKVKIVVTDTFKRKYRLIAEIDRVSLKEARKFNPKFGMTLRELDKLEEPFDLPMDKHGNLIESEMRADDQCNANQRRKSSIW